MSDTVTIFFDWPHPPSGARAGERRGVPEHIARALCDSAGPEDITGGEPFAHRVGGERQTSPPRNRMAAAPRNRSLADHTVDELKDMLRERDLKVSGRKAELIERLEG